MQGVEFYSDSVPDDLVPALMFLDLGGYHAPIGPRSVCMEAPLLQLTDDDPRERAEALVRGFEPAAATTNGAAMDPARSRARRRARSSEGLRA